jgi:hypothetical protein
MIIITIGSSQSVANIPSTVHEFQSIGKMSPPAKPSEIRTSIGVVVGSDVQSVTLATRPVALERALNTQRLNQSLQMGYLLPLQSTSSK